jgi:hypothetical protein
MSTHKSCLDCKNLDLKNNHNKCKHTGDCSPSENVHHFHVKSVIVINGLFILLTVLKNMNAENVIGCLNQVKK